MKKLVGILSVMVVALAIGVIHLRNGRDIDHQRLADMQHQLKALATKATEAASVESMKTSAAATAVEQTTVTSTGDADSVVAAPPVVAVRSSPRATMEMMASAEHQARVKALSRATYVDRYPDIGKALNLSSEEVNRLFDVLARQEADERREIAAGMTGRETSTQALGRRRAASEAELSSLLGGKFVQWQEYTAGLPSRQIVKDLTAVLNAEDMPISDAQAESLLSALVAEQKRITQEAPVAEVRQVGGQQIRLIPPLSSQQNSQRLNDVASRYLSPQQLEAMQKMMDRKRNFDRTLFPIG